VEANSLAADSCARLAAAQGGVALLVGLLRCA
jgi:hypothetical protein